MKKFLIFSGLLLGGLLFATNVSGQLRVFQIPQGGTSTSTAPDLNEILIGNSQGTYDLTNIGSITGASSDWSLQTFGGGLFLAPTTSRRTYFPDGFISKASSTIDSTLKLSGALTSSSTATSTFQGGLHTNVLSLSGTFDVNNNDWDGGDLVMGGYIRSGTGNRVIDVGSSAMYDNNEVASIDFASRELKDATGSNVAEWGAGFLNVSSRLGVTGTATSTFAGGQRITGGLSTTQGIEAPFVSASGTKSSFFNGGFIANASSTIVGPLGFGTPFSTSTAVTNHSILLKTDQTTDTYSFLLGLKYDTVANLYAKANIAYVNGTNTPMVWLSTHDALSVGNNHFHWSVETKERTSDQLQSRFEVEHTCDSDECDVATASGANFVVGSGGDLTLWDGDMFTRGAFDLFPNSAWNSTVALRVATTSSDKLSLAGLGTSNIVIDDAVHVTGNLTASGTTMGVDSSGTATHYVSRAATTNFASFIFRNAFVDQWTLGLRNDSTNNWYLRDNINGRNLITSEQGDDLILDPLNEVGIATTTPWAKLSVEQTGTDPVAVFADQANDTSPVVIDANGRLGIGVVNPTAPIETSATGNQISFQQGSFVFSQTNGSAFWRSGFTAKTLGFANTSSVNQVQIDLDDGDMFTRGFFGAGTTTPGTPLSVAGHTVLSTTTVSGLVATSTIQARGTIFATGLTGATGGTNQDACIVAATGEIVNETTGTCVVSSRRFKHDIEAFRGLKMDVLMNLIPSSFKRNGEDVTRWGFVAEEVAEADPHLATYGEDGLPRGLDEHALLALSIKSIQELNAKLTKLESRNRELEARIEKLETVIKSN